MANRNSAGFGLVEAMRVGNTPSIQGQSKYDIDAGETNAIFHGEPVKVDISASTGGYIVTAAAGTAMVGVLNGVLFTDATTKKPTFANSVAASQAFGTNPNTGSTDGFAFVNDDPIQEYTVKADAAVTKSMIGQVGNINDFSATDAKDGQSTATLDVGPLAETKMFRVVRVAEDPKNEDATAAGCNVIAVMNGAANLFINGRDS